MGNLQMDLNKSKQALQLSLQKAGVPADLQMEVAFILDVSGSFDDEHRDGLTQMLLNRLVPWGMVFDPDQQLDVFTFSSGEQYAYHVGTITPETTDGFIEREIIAKVPGYNYGTDYSYVLEKALREFGWLPEVAPEPKKRGFFSRREAPAPVVAPSKENQRPSLIIFVTDGANRVKDQDRTRRVLQESQRRGDEVYFLFIGVSNQPGEFRFLEQVGDEFDNTGLTVINDLREFDRRTDDEINAEFLEAELLDWMKKEAAQAV